MSEFENSFKGLRNIISERKLHKNKIYCFSGFLIIIFNAVFFFTKNFFFDNSYYSILKAYIGTFLPAFITFSGFTMTAYSLVVGFLNYGVFKSTIEKWYRIKINLEREQSNLKLPKYSLYQHGIALFALAILTLVSTVVFFLVIKFFIELDLKAENGFVEIFNAILLTIAILLTNYCCILIIYNVVNIFTFSQSLNKLVYEEQKKEIKGKKE
ncbi:hypothetical protein K2F45_06930 [Sphingobacterium siyangense]|uniref:hypothetical protein n=1 Tax=Sphingobacterium siyangense TaxID=459529 RepID=UPI00200DCBC5|nr:hypothetical protein [Sphingobacterium siyangense]UQA76720.1 hypothetical protein K2F45_06930 [Sphingobacterium siyangense]